jgi:hypothetical protein
VLTVFAEEKFIGDEKNPDAVNAKREELREIGRYMTDRVRTVFKEYPNHPMKLVDVAGPHTLILELSLSEVIPTNVLLNVAGTAGGLFVPGGGAVNILAAGSVAMEARVIDGATGKELVEFKDREADKVAPFTFKDFQKYAHIRKAIDEWATEIAELAATPYEHKVDGGSPFTLNPF